MKRFVLIFCLLLTAFLGVGRAQSIIINHDTNEVTYIPAEQNELIEDGDESIFTIFGSTIIDVETGGKMFGRNWNSGKTMTTADKVFLWILAAFMLYTLIAFCCQLHGFSDFLHKVVQTIVMLLGIALPWGLYFLMHIVPAHFEVASAFFGILTLVCALLFAFIRLPLLRNFLFAAGVHCLLLALMMLYHCHFVQEVYARDGFWLGCLIAIIVLAVGTALFTLTTGTFAASVSPVNWAHPGYGFLLLSVMLVGAWASLIFVIECLDIRPLTSALFLLSLGGGVKGGRFGFGLNAEEAVEEVSQTETAADGTFVYNLDKNWAVDVDGNSYMRDDLGRLNRHES